MKYVDGPRLRRSVLAAADWVDAGRDELNRINVFPVPDGDTGTNFAMTLRAVATHVRALAPDAQLPQVTAAIAESSVLAARGNSGMLLSQFLLGFRERLDGLEAASASEVAAAIAAGADRLYQALDQPVEGTILTVAREAAAAGERIARETANVEELMRRLLDHAEVTLARTPELLAVLRDAGVVDAGAKAFVLVLEGVVRLIEGDPIVSGAAVPDYDVPDAAALAEVAVDQDFQFCTQVLVRGDALPPATEVRTALRRLGGSVVVLTTGQLLKVHVHTDTPDEVFGLAAGWGAIESTQADDMREQHRRLHETTERVAIVVDSSCDLPDAVVDRYGMVIVPVQVIAGDNVWLDRVEIRTDEVYERMRAGEVFTTSQPTPGAFVQGFQDAVARADEVVAVLLSRALSGTFASGQAAARAHGGAIRLVDSRSASLGLGLLALRGAELAREGRGADQIAAELDRIRDRSGGFFTVDTFENLLRSGRVGRGRAWLGQLLDVKPILEIDREGKVVPLDRVRGREALIPRVLKHLEGRLTPRPRRLRLGVVHADAPEVAERLRTSLEARFAPRDLLVTTVTAALGVHTGPGAWGIFYQIEDEPTSGESTHR